MADRTGLLFIAVTLFLTGLFSEAFSGEALSLPFAPLLVIRAETPKALEEVYALPPVQAGAVLHGPAAWSQCKGAGRLSTAGLQKALATTGAGEVRLFVLPPSRLPLRVVLTARYPEEGAAARGLAAVKALAGRTPWQEAKRRSWRGVTASALDGLALCRSRTRLVLGSDPETLDALLERKGGGVARPWRKSLEGWLGTPARGMEAWLNGQWSLSVAESLLPPAERFYLSNFRNNLEQAGHRLPPALLAGCQPSSPARVYLALPPDWTPDSLSASSGTGPGIEALPKDCELRIAFSSSVPVKDNRQKDLLHGHSLWQVCNAIYGLLDPEGAQGFVDSMAALQMLTGLHPARDGVDGLDRSFAFGMWQAENRRRAWGLAFEVDDPKGLQLSIERMLAWSSFFSGRDGATLKTSALSLSGWGKEVRVEAQKVRFSFLLKGKRLLVARRPDDIGAMLACESAGKQTGQSGWIQWDIKLRPETRRLVAERLAGRPARNEDMVSQLSRAALVSQLASWMEAEQGSLGIEQNRVTMAVSGKTPPMATVAACARWLPGLLGGKKAPHKTRMAGRIAGILRTLLSAQQVYYHMRLGAGTGDRKVYTETLSDLVNGKAENGQPLRDFVCKQFPTPEDAGYTFADLITYLAGGGLLHNYRVLQVNRLGSEKVDPRKRLVLVAVPAYPARDPLLLIDEQGRCWWRKVDGKVPDPLPALNQGWSRW